MLNHHSNPTMKISLVLTLYFSLKFLFPHVRSSFIVDQRFHPRHSCYRTTPQNLQVRNLKFLAPFSTLANFITLVSFGIILYYIFREPISFEGREAVGNVAEFPLFFGTVLFALEAIGVVGS